MQTPWCFYKCFAREGGKSPSFHAGMLSTLRYHEDRTPHSLGLEVFINLLSILLFHNQAATLSCSCVSLGRMGQLRAKAVRTGVFYYRQIPLISSSDACKAKTCKQLAIFCACMFLNFGENCLVFEFSLSFSISDQRHWKIFVAHGVTMCIPESPGN